MQLYLKMNKKMARKFIGHIEALTLITAPKTGKYCSMY